MTTIGVSVAVPDPWGAELQAYRVGLGDAAAARIPTHITLLPPLDVEGSLVPKIVDHLRTIAAATDPFTVHLRGTGSFRPVSPVVFVNVVEGISACEVLASAVRRGPLAVEARFPYHPHVTVAHHLEDALLDKAFEDLGDYRCRFFVEHISLYVQQDGHGWVPARELELGA